MKLFLLVAKPTTILAIFTLTTTFRWDIQQIDADNTFLNGSLQEEVYMPIPLDFESPDMYLVCRLNKELYGPK